MCFRISNLKSVRETFESPCALLESSQVRRLGFPNHPYSLYFMIMASRGDPMKFAVISFFATILELGSRAEMTGHTPLLVEFLGQHEL